MKKLVRSAIQRGWRDVTLERKRGSIHYVLEWTDGTKVWASATPSCNHAVKNCEADLKRVEKQVDMGEVQPYTCDKFRRCNGKQTI